MAAGRGLNFLERTGLIETYRNPEPRIEPRAHKVHSLPLAPPLPLPNLVLYREGVYSAPDRGVTLQWPHPESE